MIHKQTTEGRYTNNQMNKAKVRYVEFHAIALVHMIFKASAKQFPFPAGAKRGESLNDRE